MEIDKRLCTQKQQRGGGSITLTKQSNSHTLLLSRLRKIYEMVEY